MSWANLVERFVLSKEEFIEDYLKFVVIFQTSDLMRMSREKLLRYTQINVNFWPSSCAAKDFAVLLNWAAMIAHGKKSGTAIANVWVGRGSSTGTVGPMKDLLEQRSLLSQPANLSHNDFRTVTGKLSSSQPKLTASECAVWGMAISAADFAEIVNAAASRETGVQITLAQPLRGNLRGIELSPHALAAMARCGRAEVADFLDAPAESIVQALAREGPTIMEMLSERRHGADLRLDMPLNDEVQSHTDGEDACMATSLLVPASESADGSTRVEESGDELDYAIEDLGLKSFEELRTSIERGSPQEDEHPKPTQEDKANSEQEETQQESNDDIHGIIRRAQEVAETRSGFFKTVLCNFYLAGECPRGDQCTFAHGVAELRGGKCSKFPRGAEEQKFQRTVQQVGAFQQLPGGPVAFPCSLPCFPAAMGHFALPQPHMPASSSSYLLPQKGQALFRLPPGLPPPAAPSPPPLPVELPLPTRISQSSGSAPVSQQNEPQPPSLHWLGGPDQQDEPTRSEQLVASNSPPENVSEDEQLFVVRRWGRSRIAMSKCVDPPHSELA